MRSFTYTLVALLVIGSPPIRAQRTARQQVLIADALDWYSMWRSLSSRVLEIQTCRGELRTGLYRFRCDPLSVVVDVTTDKSGRCSIAFMRPAVNSHDGLQVQKFAPPEGVKPQANDDDTAPIRDCGELPIRDGMFEIRITPRARPVDEVLTTQARDVALAYNERGGDGGCVLKFPKVHLGDPFFHVYEECAGALEQVWEFAIRDGVVATSPQWLYSRERGYALADAEARRNQPDLWFEISTPRQRQVTPR